MNCITLLSHSSQLVVDSYHAYDESSGLSRFGQMMPDDSVDISAESGNYDQGFMPVNQGRCGWQGLQTLCTCTIRMATKTYMYS